MTWASVPLEKLAVDMQPGFACQPTSADDGVPQLRTNNVSSEGRIDLSEVKYVPATQIQIKKYSLRPDDILFNNTNSPALVGKTASFHESGRFLFSNHMTRIRVDRELVEPRYVARFLHWAWSQGAFRALVTQWVNQAAINRAQLETVCIPLPPLSEQRRIAEILDQADRLRRLRAEADAKADRILPALFRTTFGSPDRCANGAAIERLDSVVDIGGPLVDPNSPEYLDLPHVGGEQIEKETGRLLSLQSVRDSHLRSAKFFFTESHVLYCKIRPYLNKVTYPRTKGLCSADIYPLLPKDGRLGPWYLTALLRSNEFLTYARGHSERLRMAKLNREQLGSYAVPLPARDLLTSFEARAAAIACLAARRLESRNYIERLFGLLLHRAFSGELTFFWREAHMNGLLQEMEQQAKVLAALGRTE